LKKCNHTKETSWWLSDAKGIPLCRVCENCEEEVIRSYPPQVTGLYGRYEDVVDERIEED